MISSSRSCRSGCDADSFRSRSCVTAARMCSDCVSTISKLACVSRLLLSRSTFPTVRPITAVASSTTAAVTRRGRFRIQRRSRAPAGSAWALTGSSASHSSTSSARACAEVYRSSGRNAIALRQTASSAAGADPFTFRGGSHSPRSTCFNTSSTFPWNGGRFVSSTYSVAPRLYTSVAGPSFSTFPAACSGLMNAGVPATPTVACARPPPAGFSGPSSPGAAAPASGRPTTLARPQSTTRVSPNFPSMMLSGLTSR